MSMNSMGNTNAHWGVCGFTSTFYAMYELNPPKHPQLQNASNAFRVLAEIKTYLMILKAEGKPTLLDEIVKFTRTFGGAFTNFTIDAYIQRINSAVNKTEQDIIGDRNYGIAMPPDAVADYIRRVWDYKAEVKVVKGGDGGSGDGIIGVTSHSKPLYDGLEHYMYRLRGRIYSWGKDFGSIAEASRYGAGGVKWQVCRLIEITPS